MSAVAARLRRRPAAPAARPDRPDRRGVRRRGRSRARLWPGDRALRRHPADAGAASWRSCAVRWATPIRCCRGRSRGAWPRPCGRIAPSTSRRWRRWPAPSPTRCCRRCCAAAPSTRPMSTTAATSRFILRRATSCAPEFSPSALDGVARLADDQPVRGIATSGRGGRSLLPRHRRYGDRAGRDRRRCRCRGHLDRQCGERRPSGDRAPAGARPRSRQRSWRSLPVDRRGRDEAAAAGRAERGA